ncbi:tyrosine-type recombinase/integrase [Chloroflexota bacterium]
MRGHIVKRSKDSYSIKISLGKDAITGKYKYQWVSVKGTKKEAEKKLSEILHQIDTGLFIKPDKMILGEYLKRWLSEYARPNLSPRSYERYESIVRVHLLPSIGNIVLTQLKPEHLQKHYSTKLNDGLSPLSVRYHHTVIHKALQTALKWGLLNRNAASGTDAPRAGHNEMQIWDDFEIRRFLEVAKDSQYFALFHTALFSGMRRNELLGLRWSDIDFLFSQVSISRSIHHLRDGSFVFTQPKTAKSKRTIALSPASIQTLTDHKAKQTAIMRAVNKTLTDNDLVFCHLDGRPLRPNTISRAWSMLAAKAGLNIIRLHDARHTHASILLKQGVNPKVVQERLGHASIQITLDIYSHVTPGLQKAAIEQFDNLVSPKYNIESEKAVIEKH